MAFGFAGGKVYGPRGPESYFFMLPTSQRVLGLRVALSVKYAQDNLHIVDSLDIHTDEPKVGVLTLFMLKLFGEIY